MHSSDSLIHWYVSIQLMSMKYNWKAVVLRCSWFDKFPTLGCSICSAFTFVVLLLHFSHELKFHLIEESVGRFWLTPFHCNHWVVWIDKFYFFMNNNLSIGIIWCKTVIGKLASVIYEWKNNWSTKLVFHPRLRPLLANLYLPNKTTSICLFCPLVCFIL